MNFFTILRSSFATAAAAVALFLGNAPAVQAQEAAPVQLVRADASSFQVRIANPAQEPGRVQVVQLSTDQVLFSEATKAPAYGHRFGFSTLPTGNYAVLVSLGAARYRYAVQVRYEGTGLLSVVCPTATPAAITPTALTAGR